MESFHDEDQTMMQLSDGRHQQIHPWMFQQEGFGIVTSIDPNEYDQRQCNETAAQCQPSTSPAIDVEMYQTIELEQIAAETVPCVRKSTISMGQIHPTGVTAKPSWLARIHEVDSRRGSTRHSLPSSDRDVEMPSPLVQTKKSPIGDTTKADRHRQLNWARCCILFSLVVVLAVILGLPSRGPPSDSSDESSSVDITPIDSEPAPMMTDTELSDLEIACAWIEVPNNITACQAVQEVFRVTGPSIPTQLGLLTQLTNLFLWNSRLTGTIPLTIKSLTQLQQLDLFNNSLTGSIPTAIGSLTKLTRLQLSKNELSSTIPAEFGALTKLKTLVIFQSHLTGSIPSSLRNLIDLKRLDFSGNGLTGTIPSSLSRLTKLSSFFYLYNNNLVGTIPTSLGTSLTDLEELNLANNGLTGTIPTTLGSLVMLNRLRLNNNNLTGSIPSTMDKLIQLEELNLFMKNSGEDGFGLTGTIPSSLCSHVTPHIGCEDEIACSCCHREVESLMKHGTTQTSCRR